MSDHLPAGWITLGQAYNFLRARILADGDHFILDHFDCKYINARIDMRTGKVLLAPGNTPPPGDES
jgi:hypothetical protein